MNVKQLNRLLAEAFKKKYEERAWDLYKSLYPKMNEDNFVPFEEWYEAPDSGGSTDDHRPVEDILAEVREVLQGGDEE